MSSRKRSKLQNLLEYAAARLLVALLAYTPRPLAERLARACVRLLDLGIPRLRGTAMRNLELALPELNAAQRERIADGVFRSIARLLVAFSRFPQIDKDSVSQWMRYEGFEHFERALNLGKGVLFATAHLGNWELSAFGHGILTGPMHVVARPLDNPRVDALVEGRRTMRGNRLIQKKDFARGILKALGRNEAVGILLDQNTSPEQGVFVDFFGIPACSAVGFAKLAARSGAVVIPGFALWNETEQKYVLRFYPSLEMTGDAVVDTQRLQARIESVIREYPDQWLWIHRRWKTRPPGEPPLY